jgi:hypothetical protein
MKDMQNLYLVTGTFHGSWIYADTEGEARRIFHEWYNGESIIHMKTLTLKDQAYLNI